jgi:hypothetical protein
MSNGFDIDPSQWQEQYQEGIQRAMDEQQEYEASSALERLMKEHEENNLDYQQEMTELAEGGDDAFGRERWASMMKRLGRR